MGMSLPIAGDGVGRAVRPPRAPEEAHALGVLIDSHGRTIRDLRLSITDRCNFRCVYCMDPDVRFLPKHEVLSVEEFVRVARVCVSLGVRRIRITGGEPVVHRGLEAIIEGVSRLPIDDLSMTTNGTRGDVETAQRWGRLGLRRLTLSLDTLREDRFRAITRSGLTPGHVIGAIGSAMRAGLTPVKVNAVIVRGLNDDEVADLAGLAREMGFEMRFIEFMPLDSGHRWGFERVVTAAEIKGLVEGRFRLEPLGREEASSTSLTYAFADGSPGRVGLIAPVTRAFCGACSRLRITADGKVRPCLFSREEWDMRPVLRGGGDDAAVARFLVDAVWTKQAGHGIAGEGFVQPARPMSAIGG